VRLLARAWDRLRRSGRLVAVTLGAAGLAWTTSQTLRFNDPQGRDDLLLLTRARGLGELALEQGTLAALAPGRELFGLGDNFVLVLLATVVLFRALTEPRLVRRPVWTDFTWGATALYLLYRLVARVAGTGDLRDLPIGGCLGIEAVVIPVLMV